MPRECSFLDEEDLLSGLERDECLELFGLHQAQPEGVPRRARVLPVSDTRGQINVKGFHLLFLLLVLFVCLTVFL
jgi:hypothetical protein